MEFNNQPDGQNPLEGGEDDIKYFRRIQLKSYVDKTVRPLIILSMSSARVISHMLKANLVVVFQSLSPRVSERQSLWRLFVRIVGHQQRLFGG